MALARRVVGKRITLRTGVAVLVAAALVATGAGIAWAQKHSVQRAYSGAASYTLTVKNGQTDAVDVLTIGHAVVFANCGAGEDPGNPGHLGSGFGFGITNNGSKPILVATSGELGDTAGPQYMVIPAHSGDPVFGVGQGAIIDNGYNLGQTVPFSIIDQEGGPSVTGIVSMWLSAGGNLSSTARCVFSAQARG